MNEEDLKKILKEQKTMYKMNLIVGAVIFIIVCLMIRFVDGCIKESKNDPKVNIPNSSENQKIIPNNGASIKISNGNYEITGGYDGNTIDCRYGTDNKNAVIEFNLNLKDKK